MTFRVRILCEDRLAERFLRSLCQKHGVELLRDGVTVAPAGQNGSAWVLAQYAKRMKQLRSKSYQHQLGLIVHVDGDAYGPSARKTDLDQRLTTAGQTVRSTEPVAIFVPTWCIETWLLHLAGLAQPAESDRVKLGRGPAPEHVRALRLLEANASAHLRTAAAAFLTLTPAPQSLLDARSESTRVGIG